MENKTQNELIRQHLESGKSITPLVALNMFGCLRLGARIHNLKAMGLEIHKRLVGDGDKHYAEYSMPPSELHSRDRYAVAESMRKTVIVLLIVSLHLGVNAQKWEKTTFRPAPQIGEITSVVGIGMVATSASGIIGIENKTAKYVGYIGGLLMFTGVVIDINSNSNGKKYKYKHKVKGRLFASGDKIGFRLNF